MTARTAGSTAIVTARNDTRGWKLTAIHMSFIAGTPGAPPIPGAQNQQHRQPVKEN